MVDMKKILILLLVISCMGSILAVSVDPSYVKSSVVFGQEKNIPLSFSCEGVCSVSTNGDFFSLSVDSAKDNFVSDILFSEVSEGVHVGSVELEEIVIPVILEVNSEIVDFAITLDVSVVDKNVDYLGEILPKINLYNLKNRPMDVEVLSFVYDLEGNVLFSDSEIFSVKDKYSYVKSVSLDKSFDIGNYVFAVVLKSESGVVVSSYSFNIVEKRNSFLGIDYNFFVLIVVLILFLIIGLVFYMLFERKSFLRDLEGKYVSELKFYTKKIREEEMDSLAKAKTLVEKNKVQKEFADAKYKILSEMEKEHSKQKEELNKIKLKKKTLNKKDTDKFNLGVYNKALKSSTISVNLKNKLGTLERAYDEGIISKKSLSKGKKRIKNANSKLKRNVYK